MARRLAERLAEGVEKQEELAFPATMHQEQGSTSAAVDPQQFATLLETGIQQPHPGWNVKERGSWLPRPKLPDPIDAAPLRAPGRMRGRMTKFPR